MKKKPAVALVCAGPISCPGFDRLAALSEQLRWIKASHLSSATRAVRTLGRGTAVREYAELAGADIVLVRAPDPAIPRLVAEMAAADLDCRNRTVVLLDTFHDSLALAPLEVQGAFPASLTRLSALPDIVLTEGHPEATRRLRKILRGRPPQVMEMRRGGKAEYHEGVRLGTSAFLPTISAAIDHFRRAGMQKAAAEKAAASLFDSTIRSYFRAGKRLLARMPKPRA